MVPNRNDSDTGVLASVHVNLSYTLTRVVYDVRDQTVRVRIPVGDDVVCVETFVLSLFKLYSCFYRILMYLIRYCLVWCRGQNKGIAPLHFFHGCRTRRLEDYQHSNLIWTAMALPPVCSVSYS
jgi:hypothetical protein